MLEIAAALTTSGMVLMTALGNVPSSNLEFEPAPEIASVAVCATLSVAGVPAPDRKSAIDN